MHNIFGVVTPCFVSVSQWPLRKVEREYQERIQNSLKYQDGTFCETTFSRLLFPQKAKIVLAVVQLVVPS